jgi:dimethylhistidine N-methyltransferase
MRFRSKLIQLAPHEPETGDDGFKNDVLQGLRQRPKWLDAKYFYDATGSTLYDEICELPEYYPYRTELSILPAITAELRQGDDIHEIVEFGAGSLHKIRILLAGIDTVRRFVPIDISAAHLDAACAQLMAEFAGVDIRPLASDFTAIRALPENTGLQAGAGRIGFFPGSTIGNFGPAEALELLQNFRAVLGPGARLLIGVDRKKAASLLHRAYNDERQITARFNLNLLHRINRELGADFDPAGFEHYAFYNPAQGRVEMHLVSKAPQQVRVAGCVFHFERGESIHTENSYKYSDTEFRRMAHSAGWTIAKRWTDPDELFTVYLLQHAGH